MNFKPVDETKDSVEHLIERRVPWLFVGLLGGILTTLVMAKYEAILSADVRLAFFIPVIVYLSDAVGGQSETIYVRTLNRRQSPPFSFYLLKETLIGLGLGMIFGLLLGAFAAFWLKSTVIGLAIGLTMFINLAIAPGLAVVIPRLIYSRRTDPALGAGPLATIIQDLISLLVYFGIASVLIF